MSSFKGVQEKLKTMRHLTLSEISEQYRCTPKTFKKYVMRLGIPFVSLGRGMRFDPQKVEKFLEISTSHQSPEIVLPKRKLQTASDLPVSRFVGTLG